MTVTSIECEDTDGWYNHQYEEFAHLNNALAISMGLIAPPDINFGPICWGECCSLIPNCSTCDPQDAEKCNKCKDNYETSFTRYECRLK